MLGMIELRSETGTASVGMRRSILHWLQEARTTCSHCELRLVLVWDSDGAGAVPGAPIPPAYTEWIGQQLITQLD